MGNLAHATSPNLEDTLSKNHKNITHLHGVPRIVKSIETESRMVVSRDRRPGQLGSYRLMSTDVHFLKVRNVCCDVHKSIWRYLMPLNCILKDDKMAKK
jgi:hypothetical protein